MKKQIAQPVRVSQCTPVYINGKLKYWNLSVEYVGDLRLPNQKFLPRDFGEYGVVLNPVISVHKLRYVNTVKYDDNTGNTKLTYVFRDGIFGLGAERAWQLRIWALARINENNK